jgi:putative tryptophan/tyrosine transport system substrate-binding protein
MRGGRLLEAHPSDEAKIMKRRTLTTILATLALPQVTAGQPVEKVWRIGFLGETAPIAGVPQHPVIDAFVEALRERGYIDDRNLKIEYRFDQGDRLPIQAAELVGLKLDLIVAVGTREALALKSATSTTPIVMLFPGDPVGAGLVASLASPGGNITGTSLMIPDASGKRVELLHELVPGVRRIAILGNLKNAAAAADIRATEAASNSLGMQAFIVTVESQDSMADSLSELLKAKTDGLIAIQDAIVGTSQAQIAEFAVKHRLASVFPGRMYVQSGGLIGYGPSLPHVARRAVAYVEKILKGAKPMDLPVEQPTTFELVINLKTAKALGLTVPPALLARADEVIE